MAKEKFGTERRSESARWTSTVIGPKDFNEDHVLRPVGSFEKGKKPADPENRSDEPDKPVVGNPCQ